MITWFMDAEPESRKVIWHSYNAINMSAHPVCWGLQRQCNCLAIGVWEDI